MATPPTFVTEYESAWNTTTGPKTISVTVDNGDVLVICCAADDPGTFTPSGGGLTYTQQQIVNVSQYCAIAIFTAVASSTQTFTLSVSDSVPGWWGFNCLRFSGSDGVGASSVTNVASGAPSLSLTTTTDNCAVVTVNADWTGTDGTSRTWRTVNVSATEQTYFRDSAHYTVYAARYSDAGTAGAKTTGLSAPSGQKYSIASIEIKGSAGGSSPVTLSPTAIASNEAFGTATISVGGVTMSPGAISSAEAFGTASINTAVTLSPSGITSAEVFGTPTITFSQVMTPTGIASGEQFGAPLLTQSGGGTVLSPASIASEEAFGMPVIALGSPRWRLRDLYREVVYQQDGNPNRSIKMREGLTAYGDTAPLSVRSEVPDSVASEATYLFRGGYVHETADPVIRDLWINSGFEVDNV